MFRKVKRMRYFSERPVELAASFSSSFSTLAWSTWTSGAGDILFCSSVFLGHTDDAGNAPVTAVPSTREPSIYSSRDRTVHAGPSTTPRIDQGQILHGFLDQDGQRELAEQRGRLDPADGLLGHRRRAELGGAPWHGRRDVA